MYLLRAKIVSIAGVLLGAAGSLFYLDPTPEPKVVTEQGPGALTDQEPLADLPEAEPYIRFSGPQTLSFAELTDLVNDPVAEPLAAKLNALLNTPFVSNEAYYRGARPFKPELDALGPGMRVVAWNIERGLELDNIKEMFTSPAGFDQHVRRGKQQVDFASVEKELAVLRTADVLVLNESDWGLKRTQYRHVTSELAEALDMNWAYGVEFVEINPITLGTEKFELIADPTERRERVNQIQIDPERLRALHGTAVLSRYPIIDARLAPFEFQGYDWYREEKSRVSKLEKGKRKLAEIAFQETIGREIRRGGRTTLYVTLEVPELPEGKLTIAAAHLESRTKPENRRKQMEELLTASRDIDHPLILAGDLNTTLSDQQPTSIKREVYRRLGSKEFWANTGMKYATGVGLLYDAVKGGVNFFKNQHDPTAKHIPIVAPNPEAKLFEVLEKFRFQNGTVFDFRGDARRTINGTEGTLANSNQRGGKGFASTFEVERTLGPIGQYKLDWIFVRSYLESPRSSGGPYRFAPHFARTMEQTNYALPDRLSDHHPVSVDLPFSEPNSL
ncbi:MAG: endonuclease/exonuclease/phosphatase family protein [Acidobacteria bacterium]|nr:endonuclease/exonuclease/phosphatase family protein [Acidobacteriota bacterium]